MFERLNGPAGRVATHTGPMTEPFPANLNCRMSKLLGVSGVMMVALMMLAGCGRTPEPLALSGATMGTYWSVRVAALPVGLELAELRQEIEQVLEAVNAEMSTYRSDSVITAFNEAEAGQVIDLPPAFATVLSEALYWAEVTQGAFDPTVGSLVDLWGFGPEGAIERVPSADQLAERMARVGWQQLDFDPALGGLAQPGGVRLDLSGIAKGWGVDAVAERLLALGIENFLVDIGGDLRVRGQRPDRQGWRVAIERPLAGGGEIHAVLESTDAAIATSGDYRQFIELDGRRLSHLIDPMTGHPIDHATISVTVVVERCLTADALATALHIMPPEQAWSFAVDHDLAVLLLLADNGAVVEKATPGFEGFARDGSLP